MAYNKKIDNIPKLKEDIKLKFLKPLYLFYGEEDYLKNHYVDEICKSYGKKDEIDYMVFDGQSFDADEFYNFITAISFSNNFKVALLRNIDILKIKENTKEILTEALGQIPEGVVVIAYYDSMFFSGMEKEKVNKHLKFYKNSFEVEFTLRDNLELCRWIEKHFEKQNIETDRAFCLYLLEQTDGTMSGVKKEIEKLCSYYTGKKLTTKDIDKIIGKRFDTDIFEITNAIMAKNLSSVLTKLSDIRNNREEPYRVLAAIINTLSEFLFVKAALISGVTSGVEIAKDLGFSKNRTWLINKYIAAAASTEISYLTKCVEYCSDADIELKRSRADGWIILDRLIAGMMLLSEKN